MCLLIWGAVLAHSRHQAALRILCSMDSAPRCAVPVWACCNCQQHPTLIHPTMRQNCPVPSVPQRHMAALCALHMRLRSGATAPPAATSTGRAIEPVLFHLSPLVGRVRQVSRKSVAPDMLAWHPCCCSWGLAGATAAWCAGGGSGGSGVAAAAAARHWCCGRVAGLACKHCSLRLHCVARKPCQVTHNLRVHSECGRSVQLCGS